MNLPCKILATFFLICNLSTKGTVSEEATIVWGALGYDINLNIPGFQVTDDIDDIRWLRKEDKIKVAQFRNGSSINKLPKYDIFRNGTLNIKNLMKNSNCIYEVEVYHENGKHVLDRTIDLRILEMVSVPNITWSCANKTLSCEVTKGDNPELQLLQNGNSIIKSNQTIITHTWSIRQTPSFTCMASNKVSKEIFEVNITCTEEGLNIYLMSTIIGGGVLFFIFVALLIFYISKKKKQGSGRNDEEVEIRAHKMTTEERVRKSHHNPGSTSQTPAVSQPPPPPGHRSQAPDHYPRPVGHQAQRRQQTRPNPPPTGTQVHQQKGPPLPRPRVQQKHPPGATEYS
ncbi:PREDICTED: T-cell surface antigen CD2 [Chrysochloris asiatica]|uniref:T-cell surface antigen CD2 n=1 Tax=Chrysochloris asiatica TaxID=185453 RepID=A0A9B0U2T6_CHRAS|nr:PREDICTED: T-cell surface antigen CD2 [Chrysochloris asiatica]